MTEMTKNMIVLFLILSFIHSVPSEKINIDFFVNEREIYSTPHRVVSDIRKDSYFCATMCSMNPDCCGYTKETENCLLFHYQTSNNCRNKTDGGIELHYIKQLKDCSELPTDNPSGIYRVYPLRQSAVLVYCEMTEAGGGWTMLQRRQNGTEDFYRYWADYKRGFGDLQNEFWLGNDIIHRITSQKQCKVRFDLEDFDGFTTYAEYNTFYVDDEAKNYGLNISGYSGTAGNGFGPDYANAVVPFSTRDVDNDRASISCADFKKSGWWFVGCSEANINGVYKPGGNDYTTIHWTSWRNYQCLSKTRMMIKPT